MLNTLLLIFINTISKCKTYQNNKNHQHFRLDLSSAHATTLSFIAVEDQQPYEQSSQKHHHPAQDQAIVEDLALGDQSIGEGLTLRTHLGNAGLLVSLFLRFGIRIQAKELLGGQGHTFREFRLGPTLIEAHLHAEKSEANAILRAKRIWFPHLKCLDRGQHNEQDRNIFVIHFYDYLWKE